MHWLGDSNQQLAAMRAAATSSQLRSQIISFSKTFDLTMPEFREAARVIAGFVRSPDEPVREAVISALCVGRTTAEGVDILPSALMQGPDESLEVYGSAIQLAIRRREDVSAELVVALIHRVFRVIEAMTLEGPLRPGPNVHRLLRRAISHVNDVLSGTSRVIKDDDVPASDEPLSMSEIMKLVGEYCKYQGLRPDGES